MVQGAMIFIDEDSSYSLVLLVALAKEWYMRVNGAAQG